MAAPKEKSTVITAFVLDFETGGLDCQTCAATQLSIHAVRLDTFQVMETFNHYIYPYRRQAEKKKVLRSKYESEEQPFMDYQDRALEYSAITMDMLRNMGEPLDAVCLEIIEFFKRNTFHTKPSCKPIIVGQNILFDLGFLQQILIYTNMWKDFVKIVRGSKDFWGNFQPYYLDTIIFAQLALSHNPEIASWSLGDTSERLGIDLDDAHDADADVIATKEVMRMLTQRMRNEEVADTVQASGEVTKIKLRNHFKI